jgi:hypothetical protein
VGLGVVSGACAFVALKAGALPQTTTHKLGVQDPRFPARSAVERNA